MLTTDLLTFPTFCLFGSPFRVATAHGLEGTSKAVALAPPGLPGVRLAAPGADPVALGRGGGEAGRGAAHVGAGRDSKGRDGQKPGESNSWGCEQVLTLDAMSPAT